MSQSTVAKNLHLAKSNLNALPSLSVLTSVRHVQRCVKACGVLMVS